jgi:hypothetical protein
VGVGFYPNSSFIHLDVRGCAMQWVDYAGPGEAPRLTPRQRSRGVVASKATEPPRTVDAVSQASRAAQKRSDAPRPSDVDDIAEEVVAAMSEAPNPPRPTGAAKGDQPAQGGSVHVRVMPSREPQTSPDEQSE